VNILSAVMVTWAEPLVRF